MFSYVTTGGNLELPFLPVRQLLGSYEELQIPFFKPTFNTSLAQGLLLDSVDSRPVLPQLHFLQKEVCH